MFELLNRQVEMVGSVFFRGTMQPRMHEFVALSDKGFEIVRQDEGADGGWLLHVRHPKLGEAQVIGMAQPMLPPRFLIEMDPWLSESEKREAAGCGSMVSMRMKGRKKHVLGDRKLALRMMGALMGRDGVLCLDHQAERFWSRAELRDELSHSADLDIGSLYTTHMVGADDSMSPGEDQPVTWYHTHGLAALGVWDIDIVMPGDPHHPAFLDHVRVLAFDMLAGKARPGGTTPITSSGAVDLVPADRFQSNAADHWAKLREDESGEHRDKRVVLCEPAGRLSRLLRRGVEPSRWLRGPMDENTMHLFTDEASMLMSERARKTYPLLRRAHDEMSEVEHACLVKIGYPVDGSADGRFEYMWHEVHGLGEDTVDATLVNQPHEVSGHQAGDRRTHDVASLNDWVMMSPIGPITPRYQTTLRQFRDHREDILSALAEARAKGEL